MTERVFGAYFLTNYLIVYRRTLKSISDLQAGTKIIGSGNFDFTIPQKSNDEIGELSQAFNQMTANLKRVTASKQELVKEVSERMRAEELLKVVNGELTATNEALTSANEELAAQEEELRAQTEELQVANERNEEYASKLEEMVKERTDKLRESEERLRRATLMDTVSRIGATVAHDLRGPLVTISQAAEMAKVKPELVERMLEMITGNSDRSLRMIEEFRNATREVHVVKQNVNLPSLVKETVEAVPKPGNISLDMQLGEDYPDVPLDPEIMRRVIDNLVRNAVEAMPDGGRLTVSTRRVDGKSIIEVNDTGVGITEEAAKSLFEPLFTTKRGGMGLGLYFVRMAVEAHGGVVGFASRPGEGTTFKVTLP